MKNSLVLLLFLLFSPTGAALPVKKQLRFEDISYSQLSPQPGVSGLLVEKERMLTLFGGDASVFAADLKLDDKNFLADMTFEIPAGGRTTFDKSLPAGHWRGVVPFAKETFLFVNGSGATVMALESKDLKFISHRQIVIDLLSPAADSRGEATARETSIARKRFTKAFAAAQANGLVFSGIAPLPKKWTSKGGAQFILATHIAGFPFVTMACDEKDVTQCRLERICDLGGWRPRAATDLGGVAVSDKEGLILLVDRGDHSLRTFKAASCAHSPYQGELRLPDKLKAPTSVTVDAEGRLWVTTERPDDYRNGSVYMWEKW